MATSCSFYMNMKGNIHSFNEHLNTNSVGVLPLGSVFDEGDLIPDWV